MKKSLAISVFFLLLSGFAIAQDQPIQNSKREALYKGKSAGFWINQLKDRDASIRLDVVKALKEIGTDESGVLTAVIGATKDKDESVQKAARDALSSVPAEHIFKQPPTVIAQMGENVVPFLLDAIKTGNLDMRRTAHHTLQQLGPKAKKAVPTLIEVINGDKTQFKTDTMFALETLGSIGPDAEQAVPLLLKRLKDNGYRGGMEATTLGRIGRNGEEVVPTLMEVLKKHGAGGLEATALAAFGREAVPDLVKFIKSKEFPQEKAGIGVLVRKYTFQALKQMGPEAKDAVAALAEFLQSGRFELDVLDALQSIGPDNGKVPGMIENLMTTYKKERNDASPLPLPNAAGSFQVRQAVLTVLSGYGPEAEPAVLMLVDIVKEKGPHSQAAIYTLGRIGPRARAAVPTLVALLKGQQGQQPLNLGVVSALGAIGPDAKEAIPALTATLDQGRLNAEGKVCVAIALSRIEQRPEKTVPVLMEALKSPNITYLHGTIFDCLAELGPSARQATLVLKELLTANNPSGDRHQIAYALWRIEGKADDVVPVLVDLLENGVFFERAGAAIALGKIGPIAKEATPALLALQTHSDASMRRLAASALARITSSGVSKSAANSGQDQATRELTGDKTVYEGLLQGLAFRPDGKTLLSVATISSEIKKVRLWDIQSGKEKDTIQPPQRLYSDGAVFGPDGKFLAIRSSVSVDLWQIGEKKVLSLLGHEKTVLSLAFSPDGKYVASGSLDRTIRVWDTSSGKAKLLLKGHGDVVRPLTFSPDGKTLVSGGPDQTVRLWDLASGEEKASLNANAGDVFALAVSPDGKTLVAGYGTQSIVFWDLTTGRQKSVIKGYLVRSLVFLSNNKVVVAGDYKDTIRFFDVAAAKEKSHHPAKGSTQWLCLSPDGSLLAAGGGDAIILWNVPSLLASSEKTESRKETLVLIECLTGPTYQNAHEQLRKHGKNLAVYIPELLAAYGKRYGPDSLPLPKESRAWFLELLTQGGVDAVPGLLQGLKDNLNTRPFNVKVTFAIYEVLEEIGEPAVPHLRKSLSDDALQPAVMEILGRLGIRAKAAVPDLMEIVKADTELRARAAAIALAKIDGQSEGTRQLLKEAVRAKRLDPGLVLEALSVGASPDKAVPDLIEALSHPNRKVRSTAANLLAQYGPDAKNAMPGLIKCLTDLDQEVRENAAKTVGEIGPEAKEVVPILAEGLKNDRYFYFADALTKIGPEAKEAIPALMAAFKEKGYFVPDPETARRIKELFGEQKPQPKLAWKGEELARIGRPMVPALLKFYQETTDPDDRLRVISLLEKIGPEATQAVPMLIEALQDKVEYIRPAAMRALGGIGPSAKEAIPGLVQGLHSADRNVQKAAARGLAGIGPEAKNAMPALIEALGNAGSGPASGKWELVKAINAIGPDKRALSDLTQAFLSSDFLVSGEACRALQAMGSDAKQIVPELIQVLREGDKRRIHSVLLILEAIGPDAKAAIPLLREIAQDGDLSAARALWVVGKDESVVPIVVAVLKDRKRQNEAVNLVGFIGPKAKDAVPILAAFAEDQNTAERLRVAAALSLLEIEAKHERAVPVLLNALTSADEMLRVDAGYSLYRIERKLDRTLPILVQALKSRVENNGVRVSSRSMSYLHEIGPDAKEAVPALVQFLRSSDPWVRRQAAQTLRRIDPVAAKTAGVD